MNADTTAKKAIIYARTSRDDPKEEKVSIEVQIEECEEFAATRGYEVVGVFKDRNRSGRTHATGEPQADRDIIVQRYCTKHVSNRKHYTRDGLAEALKMLPDIDIILTRNPTRLMRPLMHSLLSTVIWLALSENGVIEESVQGGVIDPTIHRDIRDSDSTDNVKDKDVQDNTAQTIASLKAKRDAGQLYHSPFCYGYRSAGIQQVKQIPDEIDIVRRIYRECDDKVTMTALARQLTVEGVPMMDGKRGVWTTKRIRTILTRPAYAGLQRNSRGELIPCKPLSGLEAVTTELWQRVQRRFHKKQPVTDREKHALTGLVYCGYCGSRLYVHRSKSIGSKDVTWYYICKRGGLYSKRDDSSLGCRRVMIRETDPPRPPRTPAPSNPHDLFSDDQPARPDYVQQGVGLEHALFPLGFAAAVGMLQAASGGDDLRRELDELEDEAHAAEDRQADLTALLINPTVEVSALVDALEQLKSNLDNISKRRIPIQRKLDTAMDGPIEPVILGAVLQAPDQSPVARELLHQSLKRVDVYAYHIRVTLADGDWFLLERVPVRSSRHAPPLLVGLPDKITASSTIRITYKYKTAITGGDDTRETIFRNQNIQIDTLGTNPKPYEYANRRRRKSGKALPDYVYDAPFADESADEI
jgi:DNA invertase Pin-like site-specific DNA recombinase